MKISGEKNIKLSIIIPNFKSKRFLEENLASIFRNIGDSEAEIILVNNDLSENISHFQDEKKRIYTLKNTGNSGFGAACNLGAKNSKGEILLFLNPDCLIASSNISEVFERFSISCRPGVIGAGLFRKNGKTQKWSAGMESSLWKIIKKNFGIMEDKEIWSSKKEREVDWVSAAAMFVRRNVFDEIGGFDENFFMYFEDMDLCKRAREIGKSVLFFPNFKVIHFGSGSWDGPGKQKKAYYLSQKYYFKKNKNKIESKIIDLLSRFYA